MFRRLWQRVLALFQAATMVCRDLGIRRFAESRRWPAGRFLYKSHWVVVGRVPDEI